MGQIVVNNTHNNGNVYSYQALAQPLLRDGNQSLQEDTKLTL